MNLHLVQQEKDERGSESGPLVSIDDTVSTHRQTMPQSAKFVGQECEESQVFERR
jgi:hypothetical protein